MNSDSTTNRESADAEKVDAALEALTTGNLYEAESLLLGVIANTPTDYCNFEENNEGISIKFWDQTAFVHYVTWQNSNGLVQKCINWIGNAYPRAHYYMGFLCIKRQLFDRALEFLEKGQRLEPTNPKFAFEKAQALTLSGRKEEALALYDQITEINAYVGARDLALARRGRGFILIEMQDFDNAESALKSSLEIEPQNEVALNELLYIDHLRQGGAPTSAKAVASSGPDLTKCAVCGQQSDKGVFASIKGMPVSVCNRCEGKLTKKWWQFWR